LSRVGTKTSCGRSPRATSRSIAPIAAAWLDPGRTRSCVAAVAPSTEIWTQSTASAVMRSAPLASMRLPSVSSLIATRFDARRSKTSHACATPSGSPPPNAT